MVTSTHAAGQMESTRQTCVPRVPSKCCIHFSSTSSIKSNDGSSRTDYKSKPQNVQGKIKRGWSRPIFAVMIRFNAGRRGGGFYGPYTQPCFAKHLGHTHAVTWNTCSHERVKHKKADYLCSIQLQSTLHRNDTNHRRSDQLLEFSIGDLTTCLNYGTLKNFIIAQIFWYETLRTRNIDCRSDQTKSDRNTWN